MHGSSLVLAACVVHSCLALAVDGSPWTPKRQALLPTCELPKCQSVKDKAGCILPLISLGGGSVDQLVACVAGDDKSLLCSCGGCVNGLVDFLDVNSVC